MHQGEEREHGPRKANQTCECNCTLLQKEEHTQDDEQHVLLLCRLRQCRKRNFWVSCRISSVQNTELPTGLSLEHECRVSMFLFGANFEQETYSGLNHVTNVTQPYDAYKVVYTKW